MPVGVSTSCFYPMETEQAFLCLGQAGIRDAEIFFNAASEAEQPQLQTILDIQKKYEITVRAVHPYCTFAEPYLLFSNYMRRFRDGVEIYRRLGDTCHSLGCDVLILHGDREPFHVSAAEYAERYCMLAQALEADGIRLTQENVVRFRSADLQILRTLRDALGEKFYMTFDVKQAVRCGFDPLAIAKEFAPYIVHVHLSDHGPAGDCLLPGRGSFDFRSLFSVLHGAKGNADYVLEVYRGAFQTDAELVETYKTTADLLSERTNL